MKIITKTTESNIPIAYTTFLRPNYFSSPLAEQLQAIKAVRQNPTLHSENQSKEKKSEPMENSVAENTGYVFTEEAAINHAQKLTPIMLK